MECLQVNAEVTTNKKLTRNNFNIQKFRWQRVDHRQKDGKAE